MTKFADRRIDNHSHIIHADIRHMVAAAKSNGLTEYSITEHISQFRELKGNVRFGSVHTSGRVFVDLKEYTSEFQKIQELASSTKVWRGLEVDFAPRFESKVGDFVKQEAWDILLCSVHEFENAVNIEKIHGRRLGHEEEHRHWQEYFALQRLALESNFVPFDVLAHPVRMSRGLEKFPPNLDDLLLELAILAKRRGKALELNGNDIDYAPRLVRSLAEACSKAGCKVSLGSDAHLPNNVFRNMSKAADLVDEFQLELFSPSSKRS